MDFDPTTEDPDEEDRAPANTTPEDPVWWSKKGPVRLPVKVAELRRKLYQKAKQEPKFRFYALYDRICRSDVLTAAWWIVLAKNKTPGIDGVTCRDIMDAPGGAAQYLVNLEESLRTTTYRPDRMKQRTFDKKLGLLRMLDFTETSMRKSLS